MGKASREVKPLQCGVCTACCFTHAVEEIGKPMFTRCPHLGPVEALGGREGCTIYDDRPQACRKFACSWLKGIFGREAKNRPNNLGIVTSGHEDKCVHVTEVWPGAINRPDVLKWFCEQTRAAEEGRIQPVLLNRECGKLLYGKV